MVIVRRGSVLYWGKAQTFWAARRDEIGSGLGEKCGAQAVDVDGKMPGGQKKVDDDGDKEYEDVDRELSLSILKVAVGTD